MTRSFDRILTATVAEPIFPPVTMPVDVNDPELFPHIAEARKHFASLPAERRAELERTWR